nr:basic proline-rich protein-like [Dasypus novemcinctus]
MPPAPPAAAAPRPGPRGAAGRPPRPRPNFLRPAGPPATLRAHKARGAPPRAPGPRAPPGFPGPRYPARRGRAGGGRRHEAGPPPPHKGAPRPGPRGARVGGGAWPGPPPAGARPAGPLGAAAGGSGVRAARCPPPASGRLGSARYARSRRRCLIFLRREAEPPREPRARAAGVHQGARGAQERGPAAAGLRAAPRGLPRVRARVRPGPRPRLCSGVPAVCTPTPLPGSGPPPDPQHTARNPGLTAPTDVGNARRAPTAGLLPGQGQPALGHRSRSPASTPT